METAQLYTLVMKYAELKRIKMPCIYKIVNLQNEEMYIGSAWYPFQRQYDHFKRLKRGTHKNWKLQGAVNKYGIEWFQFEVIKKWDVHELSRKTLFRLEQQYLDNLKPEYNIKKDVNGFIMNDLIKQKLANARAQRWVVTNLQGVEIEIINLKKFCCDNNICKKQMLDVANGRSSNHKGWKCRRLTDTKQPYIRRLGKEYNVTFPDGSVHRIRSLMRFCKEHGLSYHNMAWHRHSFGYKCSDPILPSCDAKEV